MMACTTTTLELLKKTMPIQQLSFDEAAELNLFWS